MFSSLSPPPPFVRADDSRSQKKNTRGGPSTEGQPPSDHFQYLELVTFCRVGSACFVQVVCKHCREPGKVILYCGSVVRKDRILYCNNLFGFELGTSSCMGHVEMESVRLGVMDACSLAFCECTASKWMHESGMCQFLCCVRVGREVQIRCVS